MTTLIAGIVVVAAISAVGDYVWYEIGVEHRMWTGILHGALLLTAVGGTLGAVSGRLARGLPIGTVAGVVGALAYYALQPVIGFGAMIAAWALLWIMLAVLDGRVTRAVRRPLPLCLIQGASAALLSGVTFYLVVSSLWGPPPPGGRNYAIQFAMWALAWAPGILAIGQDLRRSRAVPARP
jgi:hypothetical protein